VSPITRGRVLRGDAVGAAERLVPPLPMVTADRARRITREELHGLDEATRIIAEARQEATDILARARADGAQAVAKAAEEAREAEQAKLAAVFLALRVEDERRAERDLDRTIELAKLLAERVVGHALEQDRALIASLARQALSEARGANRVTIDAHPLDAEALQGHLLSVGFDAKALEIRPDSGLSRGSLMVHTNLGTLDAKLTPQLERLGAALRDALRSG
jgi:flagellar biosynthesis/type III secretory pathway protein FliH